MKYNNIDYVSKKLVKKTERTYIPYQKRLYNL